MNEIVVYDNTLNTLQFKNFTPMDYNILMCLCHKMKDRGEEILVFSFTELKALTGFGNHSDKLFAKNLERMIAKLIQVNATHIAGGTKSYFSLFPTFTIDYNARTLTVRVNPDFAYILNAITKNFTEFELKEFASLEGKYVKAFYKSAKQYKYKGWWKPTVNELKVALDIPDSYTNKSIMKEIIKPTIEALSTVFCELKCETITAKKRGAPIERYAFSWAPEKRKDKIPLIHEKKNNNPFNNFPQNKYDFVELEKQLLDN